MTIEDVLQRLEGVRPHGAGKWSAQCPAHQDKNPSLSIGEEADRILLHCFACCDNRDIVAALGLTMADLFFYVPDSRSACRERVRRTEERQRKTQRDEADGFTIDLLREADYFVRSRRELNISEWSIEQLHDELNALGDAYLLLESEALHG